MGLHAFGTLPFWLMVAGVSMAYWFYMINPKIPAAIKKNVQPLHTLLDNKYYMDRFNELVFALGSLSLGKLFWNVGDRKIIDGGLVNGSARLVGWFSSVTRQLQTGFLYHYAFAMIVGVGVLMLWVVLPLLTK
jgi:NADH-quinone oxidoreductase subunit L